MVREGLFDRFPVRSVFALHNFPVLPEGAFAICKGPMMAAYDVFDIEIKGKGGHAATPQNVKDPILASAYLVNLLQSIVSRDVNPAQAAVISVTEIHGGTSYNIIPDTVRLRGTTRHFLPAVQDMVEARMREICAGVSASFGVAVDMSYERRYPPLVNTDRETDEAVRAATHGRGKGSGLHRHHTCHDLGGFCLLPQGEAGGVHGDRRRKSKGDRQAASVPV